MTWDEFYRHIGLVNVAIDRDRRPCQTFTDHARGEWLYTAPLPNQPQGTPWPVRVCWVREREDGTLVSRLD